MNEGQAQPVEQELGPSHVVGRPLPELVPRDRIRGDHELVAQRPEPHRAFGVDATPLQLALVPAPRGFDHVPPRRETAAGDDGRGHGTTGLATKPSDLQLGILEGQTVADPPATESDDPGRHAPYPGIPKHVQHRTPPIGLQPKMRVSVHDHSSPGLSGSRVAGAGDAVVLDPMPPDPAAPRPHLIRGAVGGPVVDHDDLASLGQRVVDVLDRSLELLAFVAADDDDADPIGHSPQARHCPSVRPGKTLARPCPPKVR